MPPTAELDAESVSGGVSQLMEAVKELKPAIDCKTDATDALTRMACLIVSVYVVQE